MYPTRESNQAPLIADYNMHPHWIETNDRIKDLYEQLLVFERQGNRERSHQIKIELQELLAYNRSLWPI